MTDWTRGSYSALSRAMEYFNKYAGLDENGNQTGPMAGGIVLFAAGNDASSEVCYPAADANAISVGATAFTAPRPTTPTTAHGSRSRPRAATRC